MKLIIAVIGMFFVWSLTTGTYNIDLKRGVVQFSSEDDTQPSNVINEFRDVGSFKRFNYMDQKIADRVQKNKNAEIASDLTRIETDTGANVDPQAIRFHSKNRLKDNTLLVVKRKIFGSNLRDGYRFIFYFYGINSLGAITERMNKELGLDNKYHLVQYKNEEKLSWIEVKSRFIILD
jgi:hypothetical protein